MNGEEGLGECREGRRVSVAMCAAQLGVKLISRVERVEMWTLGAGWAVYLIGEYKTGEATSDRQGSTTNTAYV